MRIDAHVHISLFPNGEQLLKKLIDKNILPLAVSCDLNDSLLNQKLSLKYHTPFLAGIHPWYVESNSFNEQLFFNLLASPLCLGIGECGLDIRKPLSLQQDILKKQLDIAVSLDKPVSIHIYKTHGDLLKILKGYKGKLRGMIHGFNFSKELAREYLNLGFYLSFGRYLVKESAKVSELLKFVPADFILLETDADYKNHYTYDFDLPLLQYQVLSKLLNQDEASTEAVLYKNFSNLFLGKHHDLRLFSGCLFN